MSKSEDNRKKMIEATSSRPILKWAGGKTQLLEHLLPKIPVSYNRYIEPFFGGGALFFHLRPGRGLIADINPELINLYKAVAADVDTVIGHLSKFNNDEKSFYEARAQNWTEIVSSEAAARTIFLNRTCFNGLYRVNKSGQFNVPFGRYRNPKILDENALRTASALLKKTEIICADYKTVLKKHARAGDVVFLDPPYLPISVNSDFKRYNKEQFHEKDHFELAEEVNRLHALGCHIILTNSNHPLVHELYRDFDIQIVPSRRYISCRGGSRKGEDVIVTPKVSTQEAKAVQPIDALDEIAKFPSTRYMGSKSKLLSQIWAVASRFEFDSVLDLFSGSGVVGYMFKARGKKVFANDYMVMSATIAKALIENKSTLLTFKEAESLCLTRGNKIDDFVSRTFKDLYFTDDDNAFIDTVRANIKKLKDPYKRALAMTALIRACFKKRPRGVFTYVGKRYEDGRKDLKKSFHQQFIEAVDALNKAVFDNGKNNKVFNQDAMSLVSEKPDLVYIDPPYYSPLSDNEYVRRYHFVEGLARDWKGVEIQQNTLTKKFKNYPTPFASKDSTKLAFDKLFSHFCDSILIVSYSSNSLPTMDDMIAMLKRYKKNVEVVQVDYKYSFGTHGNRVRDNKNSVKEYIFLAY